MALSTLDLKLVWMAVIFCSTSSAGCAPVLLNHFCGSRLGGLVRPSTRARLLSCASCFTAGVFLFVCFMGLLPSADSKFHVILEQLEEQDHSWEVFAEFPWGFFLVTVGFLVIFSIDCLVHAAEEDRIARRSRSQTAAVPLAHKYSDAPSAPPLTAPSADRHLLQHSVEGGHGHGHGQNHGHDHGHGHGHGHTHAHDGGSGHGVPSSLVFLMALSIHSLFEGAAIGLQTEREKLIEFGVAVLMHEALMALTFGMEVSRSQLSLPRRLLYVLLFTATIPAGIGLGAALMENSDSAARRVIAAVMEAFATGIFIHVIFVEILAHEFGHHPPHENERSVPPDPTSNGAILNHNGNGVSTEPPSYAEASYSASHTAILNSEENRSEVSSVWRTCEKLASMVVGMSLLIMLSLLAHSEH